MSKNFWAIIFGSAIISIGIIIAGNNIANHINIPDNLSVNTNNGQSLDNNSDDTFLSESEAAAFLKLTDTEFQNLLQTGVLNTSYATIQGQRVYSKKALSDYIWSNIGNGVPKS